MPISSIRQITKRGQRVWCADYTISSTGKRKRIFRDTKEEAALDAGAELDDEAANDTLTASSQERAWIRQKIDGCGLTLADLSEAVRMLLTARTAPRKSIEEAIQEYTDSPRHEPLSASHERSVKSRFKKIAKEFAGESLCDISAGQISTFLAQRGASAPNYFSTIRALMNYADLHEWIKRNPMEKVERPHVTPKEKRIFTPDEMTHWLRAASGLKPHEDWQGDAPAACGPLLRSLILGGFCGLRYTEGLRAQAAHLDLTAGELHVPNMKTKKRGIRERWVRLSPLAIDWLQRAGVPEKGALVGMSDRNLRINRAPLTHAGLPWYYNALRRSFGSYDIAAFEDAAKTAEKMGHKDAETTKAKYQAVRRKSVALAWFELTPELVCA